MLRFVFACGVLLIVVSVVSYVYADAKSFTIWIPAALGALTPVSPGAKTSAIVAPTGTTSPGRAVTSPSTPEAGASISTVTLSVSISTIGSPLPTRSPACFSHFRTLPVSWASSSAGMMTLVDIG